MIQKWENMPKKPERPQTQPIKPQNLPIKSQNLPKRPEPSQQRQDAAKKGGQRFDFLTKRQEHPDAPKPMPRSHSATRLSPKTPMQESKDKFKDELERHIQASTLTLVCKKADECLDNAQKAVNLSLKKAYESLHKETHDLLLSDIESLYRSLSERLARSLDEECSARGLALPVFEHTTF